MREPARKDFDHLIFYTCSLLSVLSHLMAFFSPDGIITLGPTNKIVTFLVIKVGAEHLKISFLLFSFNGKMVIHDIKVIPDVVP